MFVIGLLSMVGDGGGHRGVVRALGGCWRMVRVGAGSLIYRQIKWLHCSGYLLVVYKFLPTVVVVGSRAVSAISSYMWQISF